MRIEDIKELVKVLENSSFSKVEINAKEDWIKLERNQVVINPIDKNSFTSGYNHGFNAGVEHGFSKWYSSNGHKTVQ